MSALSPSNQKLAQEILSHESAIADAHALPLARACERLRLPLIHLAGVAGFSALLARALALAKRYSPGLSLLQVNAEGFLTGLEEMENGSKAQVILNESVSLLGELLQLLVRLIGESLTLGLVREAWPTASFESMLTKPEEES